MAEAADKVQAAGSGQCSSCGASLRPGDTACWLCRAPVFGGRSAAAAQPNGTTAERTGGFSLASLMMFVTLLSVVFGLSTIAPGVGIPLGVLLLVAWGRTVSVSRRRTAMGATLTQSQQIQMYFSSLGFVIALLALVTVGVLVALGSICFGFVSVAGGFGYSPAGKFVLAMLCLAALLAAFGLLRLAGKLNDYQWRRTAEPKRETPKGKEKR